MNEDDPKLLKAAEAVADGTPYAWPHASDGGEKDELLKGLRLIEGVAHAHRGLPPPAETTQTIDTPTDSLPNPWGSLELRERIGEGGFGEVYRCFDTVLQREVALKLRKPRSDDPRGAGDKLLEEARRLARVRHPSVITVYGAEERGGRLGIWMDLIRGRTLEELLDLQGPLSASEVTAIGGDLCRALAAVHAAGLVHRDVKTSNVMREDGGRIVLMDFGSGREFKPGGEPVLSQHVHGTPLTMAPEQLRGEVAGPPTDLYGLGVLLFRLLTRHYPIEVSTFYELVEAHRDRRARSLRDLRPDLPSSLVRVVERALDPDPTRRFASAGLMERALAETASDAATPTGARRPSRLGVAVASAVAVAAIAVVLVVAGQKRRAPEPVVNPGAATIGPAAADSTQPTSSPASNQAQPETRRGVISPATPTGGSAPETKVRHLMASADFYRWRSGVEERLLPGARIGPGDELSMVVESDETLFLYVLNEDQAGVLHVLFPLPGLDTQNPLAGRAPHRLPGRLQSHDVRWRVTAPGGTETVLAIASRTPLTALERDLAGMPHASYAAPVSESRLSQSALRTLRSIGGLTDNASSGGAPTGVAPAKLSTALGALPQSPEAAATPWVWQIQLSNPER